MMKTSYDLRRWLVVLLCVALVTPKFSWADDSNANEAISDAFRTVDIRLGPDGQFVGQIVDAQGRAVAGEPIELWTQGRRLRRRVTDKEGRFRFVELKSGVYQVLAAGTGGVARLWQPDAAPPAAEPALMLVQGPVVRGQYPPRNIDPNSGTYDGAVMRTLSNPWVFSGLIAAGVAIPIALSNGNDGDGS